ncbi:MAG: bifunctional aldolase/short-chain dehydrogenase [Myxococcota bacterium]|jgi:rhamnose utilization protein RhaD (predicted bifunctional aldolase and dehydrogenase)/NAD(P)-dependent dehydrogenase (short-subunit alcohol dehydrogenase family)|nr:bifunctional aldolase/short-chain dehydrogenase [Myxococcota bacterium]
MKSQWSDAEAEATVEHYGDRPDVNRDIALRVYTSRLIGRDPSLVLHGGGNTSVKTQLEDDLGETVDVLCVKGSGWDLGEIEPEGLPAVRLASLGALREREALSDEDMVNAQRTRLLDASAPNPSVETLLHAFLPHKFIDHSHADAILSVVDQPEAEALCSEIFGDRLAIVPYVMPGFDLSKLAAEVQQRHPDAEGLLLLQHGLFTYGDTAKESYERHVRAVDDAERFIAARRVAAATSTRDDLSYTSIAPTLRGLLAEGDRRYVLTLRTSREIREYVDRPELAAWSQRGVVTPDHVIRTKALPLLLDVAKDAEPEALRETIGSALTEYRERYRAYVSKQTADRGITVKPLDPDPRIILVPGLGIIAAGASPKAASIAADIHEHTIPTITNAEAVGTFQALPEADLFEMEYWSLEQAKLGKATPKPLAGAVVLITGAASGIGEATARAFAAQGACLFLVDRDAERLEGVADELGAAWRTADVVDPASVDACFDAAVEAFGGIDGVVSNAGTAPQAPIDTCDAAVLRESLDINLLSHQWIAQAASARLKTQGTGGFLLFNASKAAFNPGKGFGPYAIAKAALVALTKQYALELGECGVRANAVNADRIRTRLLDADLVAQRAEARGLSADDYFKSNLLQREVTAEDVAAAFVNLALAKSTTGCIVTVDGGNIAASPR